MNKKENVITIGLFGTCGGSKWRDSFMSIYNKSGIEFYNPQVDDWDPSLATIEAEHLVEDEIILFPVTDETYGMGSLAEVGFSISQAINSNDERFVIIYVCPTISKEKQDENPVLAKESSRARALCLAHLKKQKHKYPNVYITNSLTNMLKVSLYLYEAMDNMKKARNICNGDN